MDKRFRIVDGENYWSKYERFVELYNDHTLSVDEVHKKLEISKNKLNAYRKRGFDEDRLIKRDHRRKGMTGKRYYAHTSLINEDKVHDKICHRFMNISETVEHMNMYYQKYTALKKENEELKEKNKKRLQRLKNQRKELAKQQEAIWGYKGDIKQLKKENKKLKEELFETSKELLWATSDEVDRALHYEDEVEELRKEIFEYSYETDVG